MSEPFVPADFEVPVTFAGSGFHLEPLAPVHNERDYEAWTSSMEHIQTTPGMVGWGWPEPMTLEENLGDMEMHWKEFETRSSFTYSILDGDEVIGCVYIYGGKKVDTDVHVRSWVRASRPEMDAVIWRELSEWFADAWPFETWTYAERS
ncbi:MAG: N-acetyltransferase [Acidimicrobiia bacterium]